MENRLYPKSYGSWAGNEAGHKPNFTKCCESVRSNSSWHSSQCTRSRGYGPDEAYCKTHDPDKVAARRRASSRAYYEKINAERPKWYGKTFLDVLQKIADGHNDPRTLAKETIAEFEKGAYQIDKDD